MKTRKIFLSMCFLAVLIGLSAASPAGPRNSAFTVGLNTMPVMGDTEYDLIVGYAVGNHAYTVQMYTGFYFVGASGKDVIPGQPTTFRIKTWPSVTHIAGKVTAYTCVGSTCSDSGYQYFGF